MMERAMMADKIDKMDETYDAKYKTMVNNRDESVDRAKGNYNNDAFGGRRLKKSIKDAHAAGLDNAKKQGFYEDKIKGKGKKLKDNYLAKMFE